MDEKDLIELNDVRYVPLLNDLKKAFEDKYGPLYWSPKAPTRIITNEDGKALVEVGPISGQGIDLYNVNLNAYTEMLNSVLEKHDFSPVEVPLGSSSGYLISESVNVKAATATIRCKGAAQFWVDSPVK